MDKRPVAPMAPATDQRRAAQQKQIDFEPRSAPTGSVPAGSASVESELEGAERNATHAGLEGRHAVGEWEGRSLPPEAQGRAYRRPEGTRVSPKTLCYRSKGGTVGRAFEAVYDRNSEARYFHSGVNRAPYFRWVAEERKRTELSMGVMVNAESAAQPALLQAYVDYPNVPVVLDSGAYQQDGKTVSEYMAVLTRIDEYLKQHGEGGLTERFEWIANLDVIEGFGTGHRFFQLRERGIEPLWVAHVTEGRKKGHTGRDFQPPPEMAFELREGMTIGIGGLVPVIKTERRTAAKLIERMGRWLGRHNLQGHFFGVGACPLIKRFSDACWFESADSAKWLQGQKGRKLYLDDGGYIRAQERGLRLSREECARQNLRQIGKWFHEGGSMQMSWPEP